MERFDAGIDKAIGAFMDSLKETYPELERPETEPPAKGSEHREGEFEFAARKMVFAWLLSVGAAPTPPPGSLLCPKCQAFPDGTLDSTPGCALFVEDEIAGVTDETNEGADSGFKCTLHYGGETRMWWDGQTSKTDEYGRLLLVCSKCSGEYSMAEDTCVR